jgi:hypothetical protein
MLLRLCVQMMKMRMQQQLDDQAISVAPSTAFWLPHCDIQLSQHCQNCTQWKGFVPTVLPR